MCGGGGGGGGGGGREERETGMKVKTLLKHTYSNMRKILPPKTENFQIKNPDICHVYVQNIDCGDSLEPPRRGGSNESPQSMF